MIKRLLAYSLIFFLLLAGGCGPSKEGSSFSSESGEAFEVDDSDKNNSSNIKDSTDKKEELDKIGDSDSASGEDGESSADNSVGGTVTVMIYMTGSDLESSAGAASNDLKEMAESGIDLSNTNLVIFTGGTDDWHGGISTEKNQLLRLTEAGFVVDKDFDLMSMGDPENLKRFLDYAAENYPADTFHLIFWNHGNGPMIGYGKDILFDNDSLTIAELEKALDESPFKDDNKLGIIGFDACLMASAELVCAAGGHAEYLISSQEVEPNFGWDYSFLSKCGKTSTREMAIEVADDYISACNAFFAEKELFYSDVTMSVTDLSYASELGEALDAVFLTAADDVSGRFNDLVVERVRTRALGRASTGSEYDLVDVKNLMEAMSERYPDETRKVLDIMDKAVICNETNTSGCNGLSLYYPYYNKNYYKSSWREEYKNMGFMSNYLKYLNRYEQVWLGSDLKDLFKDKLVPRNGTEWSEYTLELTPEQQDAYAGSMFYILRREGENLYAVVSASSGVTNDNGLLTASFDGNIIYVEDDYGRKEIPASRMWDTFDNISDYTISGVTVGKSAGMDEEEVLSKINLSLDNDSKELTVKGIYEDSDEEMNSGKNNPIDLSEWEYTYFTVIQPSYLTRDEDGRILSFWDWPEYGKYRAAVFPISDGIHLTYEHLYDDGFEYFLMFDIMDIQNNRYSSELIPIELEEAPEADEVEEAKMIQWPADEYMVNIYDKDGITLDFIICRDSADGRAAYGVKAENNKDDKVDIILKNIHLNKDIKVENQIDCYVDPNSTAYHDIDGIPLTTGLMNSDYPDSIDMTMDISFTGYKGSVVKNEKYEIKIPDNIVLQDYRAPYKGASAGEQAVYDEEGLKISVTSVGKVARNGLEDFDDKLNICYKIENNSGNDQDIHMDTIIVNGIKLKYFGDAAVMKPGDIYYSIIVADSETLSYIKMDDINNDGVIDWHDTSNGDEDIDWDKIVESQNEDKDEIENISELGVVFNINGVEHPVQISLD